MNARETLCDILWNDTLRGFLNTYYGRHPIITYLVCAILFALFVRIILSILFWMQGWKWWKGAGCSWCKCRFFAALFGVCYNGKPNDQATEQGDGNSNCRAGKIVVVEQAKPDERSKPADYLFNLFLGIIEFLAYPLLMANGHFSYVGAWVGFKAVAQWAVWTEDRTTFNRFLIGNALVVILSYLFLAPMVVEPKVPQMRKSTKISLTTDRPQQLKNFFFELRGDKGGNVTCECKATVTVLTDITDATINGVAKKYDHIRNIHIDRD